MTHTEGEGDKESTSVNGTIVACLLSLCGGGSVIVHQLYGLGV